MKFLYADSLDFVDPDYNFLEDRSRPGREVYWDDQFIHEYLGEAPFDGYLISRGIVGDHKFPGKYTQSQGMRFRRGGARKFLRLEDPEFENLIIMGDCGAYSYHKLDVPPYSPAEILEFYSDGLFTHGCSVDHIIFQFDRDLRGMEAFADSSDTKAGEKIKERWDITQSNAEAFLKECKQLTHPFVPLGVIQGWSPGSMAKAAHNLVAMGYDYLALGGMAIAATDTIETALHEIQAQIPSYVKLHLLGFGKIDELEQIQDYGVASIDTTSPMLRAFKDDRRNYFMLGNGDGLNYYTALRIPNAQDSQGLQVLIKKGVFTQEYLIQQEQRALSAVREFDAGKRKAESTLEAVMAYAESVLTNPKTGAPPTKSKLSTLRKEYSRLLEDRPWKQCECFVCKSVSIEAVIFRASNRNKRRGMHNTWIVNQRLKQLDETRTENGSETELQGNQGAAK